MITKVVFPHAMDVRGDLHVAKTWFPGKRGLDHLSTRQDFPGAIMFNFYEHEQWDRRVVVLPQGTIVHYNDD